MPDATSRPFSLLLIHDGEETRINGTTPFTIGRASHMNLVLAEPYISRQHAQINFDPTTQQFEVICLGRECFLNAAPVTHHTLLPGDEVRLGFLQGPLLRFGDASSAGPSLREALGHLKDTKGADAELGRLLWFVETARRLTSGEAVQEILAALIETTLELTHVERGYVFLRSAEGELYLASGRSAAGEPLADDTTISHTAIQHAVESGSDFILTDTLTMEAAEPSASIIVQSIRSIICIPLRKRTPQADAAEPQILGVLYLDSRMQSSTLSSLDGDLLRAVATEATLLVENAALVEVELAARLYREELQIASEIQQSLMSVRIPDLAFARVEAQSIPCTGIGGDLYDVLCHDDALYVVVADISGKGVSAAVLGCTLQGLIHGQILSGLPLPAIALFANEYICHRKVSKYATMLLLRLDAEGTVEYVNCGHVQPLLHRPGTGTGGTVETLSNGNLPVGLLTQATYASATLQLAPGERIFIPTDGVTEAEDGSGQCFGEGRLQALIGKGATLEEIFGEIRNFVAGAALADDCTMVEIQHR